MKDDDEIQRHHTNRKMRGNEPITRPARRARDAASFPSSTFFASAALTCTRSSPAACDGSKPFARRASVVRRRRQRQRRHPAEGADRSTAAWAETKRWLRGSRRRRKRWGSSGARRNLRCPAGETSGPSRDPGRRSPGGGSLATVVTAAVPLTAVVPSATLTLTLTVSIAAVVPTAALDLTAAVPGAPWPWPP